MATNSPTHYGLLPNTDEGSERILNAVCLYILAQSFGVLRVAQFDSNGNEIGLASTSTLANVASSASSVTIKAANTGRKGLIIFNDSTAILYVKFGATASTTSFTLRLTPNGLYEMPSPIYNGVVDGIWASANGFARVTELT